MKKAVICFTRIPIPGQTKTRLTPLLSGEERAALHTAFLRDLAGVFIQVDARLYVVHTPEDRQGLLRDIFPKACGFFPQEGEGLGARMENALDRVLALGYDACVLVGADLPLLTAEHLESAFSALARTEATLGPNPDGGYYLVGLRKPCPALFDGQVDGTGSVSGEAAAALRKAGVSFSPALPCGDVDTPQDLRELRPALAGKDTHTARLLNQLIARGIPL